MSDDQDILDEVDEVVIETPVFELNLGAEETDPAAPDPIDPPAKKSKRIVRANKSLVMEEDEPELAPEPVVEADATVAPAAPGVKSKDSALNAIDPTERKHLLAKKSVHPSCLPYLSHSWRA